MFDRAKALHDRFPAGTPVVRELKEVNNMNQRKKKRKNLHRKNLAKTGSFWNKPENGCGHTRSMNAIEELKMAYELYEKNNTAYNKGFLKEKIQRFIACYCLARYGLYRGQKSKKLPKMIVQYKRAAKVYHISLPSREEVLREVKMENEIAEFAKLCKQFADSF